MAQQPTPKAVCPLCRGVKTVQAGGKDMPCPRCRGSGVSGYPTK